MKLTISSRLCDFLACLSMAATCGFTVSSYASQNYDSNLAYQVRKASVRMDDFFHIRTPPMVSVDTMSRNVHSSPAYIGSELLLFISVVAVAFFLFSILQMLNDQALRRVIARSASTFAVIAFPPICLAITHFAPWDGPPSKWQVLLPYVFLAELFPSALLFVVLRKQNYWAPVSGILLLLHCVFWSYALWPEFRLFPFHILLVPKLLLIAIVFGPVSSFFRDHPSQVQKRLSYSLIPAAVAAIALVMMWAPFERHFSLGSADSTLVSIRLSRGPCFGPCQKYTLSLNGDGSLEYVRLRSLRNAAEIRHQSTLSPAQLHLIFQILDDVQFFTLEDRAFSWCFDSPSVGIQVSAPGMSKNVVSDSSCYGDKSGLQANFVQAASRIEDIAKPQDWDFPR
ncbi:MAG TPA: DUF6438 domain-containing protein [Candidatus Acidoferrum sp.]|jgi:hypothetical protein